MFVNVQPKTIISDRDFSAWTLENGNGFFPTRSCSLTDELPGGRVLRAVNGVTAGGQYARSPIRPVQPGVPLRVTINVRVAVGGALTCDFSLGNADLSVQYVALTNPGPMDGIITANFVPSQAVLCVFWRSDAGGAGGAVDLTLREVVVEQPV